MTTWRKIDAWNIEDGHHLYDFGALEVRVLRHVPGKYILDALEHAAAPHEEVVRVYEQDRQPGVQDEFLGMVELVRQVEEIHRMSEYGAPSCVVWSSSVPSEPQVLFYGSTGSVFVSKGMGDRIRDEWQSNQNLESNNEQNALNEFECTMTILRDT